jgi:hypothetical protein
MHNNTLVAVQNGVSPARVVRFFLGKESDAIEKAEVLDRNHPDYDWPTLGVVAKGCFYYVANSQWNNFNTEGNVVDVDKLQHPIILKLKL